MGEGEESFISQVGIQYSTTKVGKNASGTCEESNGSSRKRRNFLLISKNISKCWE